MHTVLLNDRMIQAPNMKIIHTRNRICGHRECLGEHLHFGRAGWPYSLHRQRRSANAVLLGSNCRAWRAGCQANTEIGTRG